MKTQSKIIGGSAVAGGVGFEPRTSGEITRKLTKEVGYRSSSLRIYDSQLLKNCMSELFYRKYLADHHWLIPKQPIKLSVKNLVLQKKNF